MTYFINLGLLVVLSFLACMAFAMVLGVTWKKGALFGGIAVLVAAVGNLTAVIPE